MRDLALAVKNQLELLRDELRAEQPNLTDGTFEQLAASYLRTLDQFEQLLRSDDSLLFEFRDDLLDATAEIRDLVDVRKSLVGARMQRLEHGIHRMSRRPRSLPSTREPSTGRGRTCRGRSGPCKRPGGRSHIGYSPGPDAPVSQRQRTAHQADHLTTTLTR